MPRVPLTERLHRLNTLDKVAELRLAGLSWRSIEKRLALKATTARNLFRAYYADKSVTSDISHAARKNEHRDKLETLDELAMRVALGASTPAGRSTGGYSVRDMLAAIESSRRVKGDLIKLDGLEGENSASGKASGGTDSPPAEQEGAEKNTALVVRRWMDGLRDRHPELYQAFATTFGEESPATHGPREQDDADQSGRDPARDADAAIEPAAPAPSPDPGLADAGGG